MNNRKTVRIAPELWRELKAEAVMQNKTIGEFIRMLLEAWKGER